LPNRCDIGGLLRSQAAFSEWFHDFKKIICEEVSLESVLKWAIYKNIVYFFFKRKNSKTYEKYILNLLVFKVFIKRKKVKTTKKFGAAT
jgi:hypothetical protein